MFNNSSKIEKVSRDGNDSAERHSTAAMTCVEGLQPKFTQSTYVSRGAEHTQQLRSQEMLVLVYFPGRLNEKQRHPSAFNKCRGLGYLVALVVFDPLGCLFFLSHAYPRVSRHHVRPRYRLPARGAAMPYSMRSIRGREKTRNIKEGPVLLKKIHVDNKQDREDAVYLLLRESTTTGKFATMPLSMPELALHPAQATPKSDFSMKQLITRPDSSTGCKTAKPRARKMSNGGLSGAHRKTCFRRFQTPKTKFSEITEKSSAATVLFAKFVEPNKNTADLVVTVLKQQQQQRPQQQLQQLTSWGSAVMSTVDPLSFASASVMETTVGSGR